MWLGHRLVGSSSLPEMRLTMYLGLWVVAKPVTQTGVVQDIVDEVALPFLNLVRVALQPAQRTDLIGVGHEISLSSSAVAPMFWDLSGGVAEHSGLPETRTTPRGFTTQPGVLRADGRRRRWRIIRCYAAIHRTQLGGHHGSGYN